MSVSAIAKFSPLTVVLIPHYTQDYEKTYGFRRFCGFTKFYTKCKNPRSLQGFSRSCLQVFVNIYKLYMGDRRIELLTSSVSRKRSTSELTTLNAQHAE